MAADLLEGTIVRGFHGDAWTDANVWDQLWCIRELGLNAYTITNMRSGTFLELSNGQSCCHPVLPRKLNMTFRGSWNSSAVFGSYYGSQ
jgi:hypothetical protein